MSDIIYMARSALALSKSQIRALLMASKETGASAVDIELPKGAKARIHLQPVESAADSAEQGNDLDQWIASRAR